MDEWGQDEVLFVVGSIGSFADSIVTAYLFCFFNLNFVLGLVIDLQLSDAPISAELAANEYVLGSMGCIFGVNLKLIDRFAATVFQQLDLDSIQHILQSYFEYFVVENPLKFSLTAYHRGTVVYVIAMGEDSVVLLVSWRVLLVSDHNFFDIYHILLCFSTNNYISCDNYRIIGRCASFAICCATHCLPCSPTTRLSSWGRNPGFCRSTSTCFLIFRLISTASCSPPL